MREPSPIMIGAANELVVSADLLHRGFQVFRALSSDAPWDLIVVIDDKMLRVQVTSGRWYSSRRQTKLQYAAHKPGTYDLVAVVVSKDGRVLYEPDIFNENPKPLARLAEESRP